MLFYAISYFHSQLVSAVRNVKELVERQRRPPTPPPPPEEEGTCFILTVVHPSELILSFSGGVSESVSE